MRLSGRVAVVTGGGSGIGRACCRLFAEEGARVVVADMDSSGGEETARQIRDSGGRALFVEARVESRADAFRVADGAVAAFGAIHVLVNNAGMRVYGPITRADEDSWDRILSVNLKGAAFFSEAVIPHMAAAGGGSIVHVSSANALKGRGGMAQYDASKAALLALARSMAADHADQGIRVNAVCPGPTITSFHLKRAIESGKTEADVRASMGSGTLLRRAAEPREIAHAILFLASDESSYVTGATLMVDGGLSGR